MALIRANRESIDDRFSVLGFTIRSEDPLYEIGLATDPDLLRSENRAKRNGGNFCSSGVLATTARRGDSVYLVPPSIVARFVGQSRLYFGLATYRENDRSRPVSVRIPDRGNMYVSLAGLTERGLRRTARYDRGNGYGGNGSALTWGGDDAASTAPATNGASAAPKRTNGNGAAAPAASAPVGDPAPYSDGYSDDLWKETPAPMATPTPNAGNGLATSPSPVAAAPAPLPAPAASNGSAGAPATAQAYRPRIAPVRSRALLVSPYYQPTNWFDALTTQVSYFVASAMWYLGVTDTTVPPHSAICQVRRPDGTDEGALHGSAFFIGPRLLLTAAHVVAGQDELIIVPGKNGGGVSTATEPFGRFRVPSSAFRQHPSYGTNGHDFDMAVICVPAANAVASPNYFDLVEELTECRQEGVVVCGYAARWYATDAIEKFVNDTIDPNKQHMMGGHIRTLPSDETFDYDLQTLGGTSGSPVYWIEEGATPRAHMVGVHVAAHSATTNLGCRMTAAKRQWIAQEAAGFGLAFSLAARSLGYRARALDDYADDPDAYGITGPIPDDGAAPTAQALRARALDVLTPEYPGASRFAIAHSSNFHVASQPRSIDHIVIHTTDGAGRTNGTIAWFQNGDQRDMKNRPIHVSSHYIVGRDGEVVQCVRNNDIAHHASQANSHTIGIEHETSTKLKLDPNEPEYAASSWLVAWLCSQFGVPVDRDHIKGHQEISPRDNHDCPGRAWDWDHYMDCVRSAAQAIAQGVDVATASAAAVATTVAPVAQSLALMRRPGFARAQEIITPFYDPKDPMSALTCQNDAFSLAREEWFMGVGDTRIFPHSAICALSMTDSAGNGWGGTGFYIGPNRILTCAHNLNGMASVTVIPGKNSAEEPFGHCTLQPSSWRVAPRYTGSGNWDNDLAVIDNVPIAAPNGQWFEFLNATPSDQMPLVVCGYSGASDAVPELTNAIDGDKQHLHGGRGAQQSNLEVIEYPILTLHGASGSPVYHLEDDGSGQLKAKVCAVHVTGQPAAQGLNRGCFITPNKLDWIEGRATTFALSQAQRGPVARRPDASLRGRGTRAATLGVPMRTAGKPYSRGQGLFDLLPVDIKIRVFIPAPVAIVTIPVTGGVMPGNSAHGGDGRGFQINGGTSRAEVTGRFRFGAEGQPTQLTDVTRTFGESANYNVEDTVAVAGMPEWYRNLKPGVTAIERGTQNVTDSKLNLELGGSSFHGILSMAENAVVVTFNIHASDPIVTGAPDIDATIALLIKMDGDRVKVRVNGGHDEFPAYEIYANGTLVYSYDPVAAGGTPWGLFGDGNWDVNPDSSYVDVGPASEYHIVGPVRIGGTSQSLGVRGYRTRALDDAGTPAPTVVDPAAPAASPPNYPVTLIPQPDKGACWAASMAMLLSYRRNASFSPETLANDVGRSLASSYSWDLLSAVRDRYGFTAITQPSNTSLYHTPQQWADWLNQYGPLWVVIVGAPHAVVVGGIRGNLADPNATQVRILNPWDTRIAFDNDPVAFNPPNAGYEDWLPFAQFAGDFGNMAQPDYGNWRVLYLPASAVAAQSLGVTRFKPAPRAKSLEDATTPTLKISEPIEPTRVAGTRMSLVRGSAGASRWALDQLEGAKNPATPGLNVSPSTTTDVNIELGEWPAIEGQSSPLPLTVSFRSTQQGAVGDVAIVAGTPPSLGYGVDVVARIDNEADVDNVAALKVAIDYRFSGFAQGSPAARIELRLLGDGRWERVNRWVSTAAAA